MVVRSCWDKLGQAGTSRSMVRLSPVIALRLKYYWLQRQKRVILANLYLRTIWGTPQGLEPTMIL